MRKILSIFLIGLLGGIAGSLLVKELKSPLTLPSPQRGEDKGEGGEGIKGMDEGQAEAEEITLTTYYPSPYGVYESMVAVRLGVGDTSGPFGSPDGKYDNLDSPPSNQPGNVWIRGNVGIGTTRPRAKLHVSGDALITSTINAGSIGAGGGTTGTVSFGGIGGSIDGYSITNSAGNYLRFKANSSGTAYFVMTNTGNVGIGMAKPGQKLTVDGVIESTSGGIKFPDGTTQVSGVPFGNVWVTNSTATFTVPPGVTRLWVEVYGGGGGGRGIGGIGGYGDIGGAFGKGGGTSSFLTLSASGGTGGGDPVGGGIGGYGGIGSGGAINQKGGPGVSDGGGSNTRGGAGYIGGPGGPGGVIVWY